MSALVAFEHLDTPPSSRPLWIVAGVCAIALHIGIAALAFATYAPDDSDDDVGAPAIEIALDMAAPKAEPSDLPPGPEAEASNASPAQVEQVKKVEQSDLPKDEPVESENPDRVVAPDAAKKPDDEKPDVAQMQANPSAESVASEATAPPTSETAREAPVSAAPVQGIGATAQRIKATWQKRLVAHLDRQKRYPGDAHGSGTVLVSFALDRTGHIVASSIAKTSGTPAFDAAALAMMRRADPVPTPPPLVADEGLSFTVPVVFRAHR